MSDEKPTESEDGFESTEDEYRSLYSDIQSERTKLLRQAGRMQPRNADAAEVLRQVAGILTLVETLTAITGGAITEIEDQLDEPDEPAGLDDEDATDFYRVFTANLSLIDQLMESADSPLVNDETRESLKSLRDLNAEMRERVVDLCQLEESELTKSVEQLSEPSEEPAEPAPTEH